MKNLSITRILLTILVCMTGVSAYADFSVENAEGVAIRYRYINDNNEVVVANDNNFRNLYSGNLVIPEEITWYIRIPRMRFQRGYSGVDEGVTRRQRVYRRDCKRT